MWYNTSDIEHALRYSDEIDGHISVQIKNNSYVIESNTQLVEEQVCHVS